MVQRIRGKIVSTFPLARSHPSLFPEKIFRSSNQLTKRGGWFLEMQPGQWYSPTSVCLEFQVPVIADFGTIAAGEDSANLYANNHLFQVPIGGKLYIKLTGLSSYGQILRPVLSNEEYGIPPFSHYADDGWFSMTAHPAHGRDIFKVCARVDIKQTIDLDTMFAEGMRYNPLFTCARVQVMQDR